MSNTHYEPAFPVSSIMVEESPCHARIHVWIKGKKAGELCVGIEELPDVIYNLFRGDQVVNVFSGGKKFGPMIDYIREPRGNCLIDEYAVVVNWDELRVKYPMVKWDNEKQAYRHYDYETGETGDLVSFPESTYKP